jgi:hypothetical protein
MGLDFDAVKGVVIGVVAFFVISVFWVAFFPVAEASGIPALHLQMIQLGITIFALAVLMNFIKRVFYDNNRMGEYYSE